jgi:hypothetical protein
MNPSTPADGEKALPVMTQLCPADTPACGGVAQKAGLVIGKDALSH